MEVSGEPISVGWNMYPEDKLVVFTLNGKEQFSCNTLELQNFIALTLQTFSALRGVVEESAQLASLEVIKEAEGVLKSLGK